jgi:hypothetical protein
MRTRHQIACYSTAIQTTQFRTRVFTFYVRGTAARLISHSRTGMEVTRSFNWTKSEHHFLHEFFWRLSHADLEHRGYDTSFRQITSLDDHHTWAAVRNNLFQGNTAKDEPIYKVQVDSTTLYVSSPFTSTHIYPVGHGTRCFSAYDPKLNRLVLLKHTWRDAAYDPEHEIYARLHTQQVPHIPDIIASADMPGCFSTCKDGQGRHQVLYCLVLSVIGWPLTTIKSSYELVQVVRDCVEGWECCIVWFTSTSHTCSAHHGAVTLASVLHRDMSVGNMIIVEGGRGMLIDWERALIMNRDKPQVSRERTVHLSPLLPRKRNCSPLLGYMAILVSTITPLAGSSP